MYAAYVGLGSNIGDRRRRLQEAVERIAAFAKVTAAARVYETEPVGFVTKHRFLNSAIALATPDHPDLLLVHLKKVERAMGRAQRTHRMDRVIDLDILMYEGLYYLSGSIEVPHPALVERRFALAPLAEIAAEVVHPLTGTPVKTLLARCADRSAVRATDVLLHVPL